MENKSKVYFISGHRDITYSEFQEHYSKRLYEIIDNDDDCQFVVGDYHGADEMAQIALLNIFVEKAKEKSSFTTEYSFYVKKLLRRVTVYHMLKEPRNLMTIYFNVKGGFKTDEERDAAMTEISDEDIAWVREGKEDSGTARNLERRKEFELKKKNDNMEKENLKGDKKALQLDFSLALNYLKIGNVIRRSCWSDAELLYYVPEARYETMTDNAKTLFGEGNKVKYGAYIAKRTKDGDSVEVWSPQTADILANDWEVWNINQWRNEK